MSCLNFTSVPKGAILSSPKSRLSPSCGRREAASNSGDSKHSKLGFAAPRMPEQNHRTSFPRKGHKRHPETKPGNLGLSLLEMLAEVSGPEFLGQSGLLPPRNPLSHLTRKPKMMPHPKPPSNQRSHQGCPNVHTSRRPDHPLGNTGSCLAQGEHAEHVGNESSPMDGLVDAQTH